MTRRSWLMMGGAAAVWGASYMFIKVALEDFSEGTIVCLRTALGAAVLLALAQRWGALAPLRGRWHLVAAIALVQVVIPFLLITFGENHIDSQLAGILVSAAPIFTALLALAFDHDERSQGWAAVGIVVGMLGVVLLFGLDLSGSSDQVVGGLMILLASLGYAAGAMLLKHKLPGAPPVGVAGGQMAVAALVTLPLCLASLPDHVPSFKAAGALVLLGTAGTGIAFLWFYTLIAEIGPARATIISYIAPGFSVVYGVVLLGEPFSVGGGRRARAHPGRLVAGGRRPAPGLARARAAGRRSRPRGVLSPMTTGVRGLHVPLVTPFDEAGAVDLAALERLAEEVLDAGADGLVALATTAEASSLDERERDAVVAVLRARRGRAAARRSSSARAPTTRARRSRATRRWPRSRA